MKYYLLNWEQTGNPVPRIRNWMGRLDYHAVRKKEEQKLPDRAILYVEENPGTIFPEVIGQPFLLVSEMFWEVAKKYDGTIRGKETILLDGIHGFAEIYYLPFFRKCDCLSEATIFDNSRSVIHHMVLDSTKTGGLPPVFLVAGVDRDYLIGRMDFTESILRRGAKGIKMEELQVM